MKRSPEIHEYRAADGWRWKLVAVNGRIVADSGEAYTRKRDVGRAIAMVQGMLRKPLRVVHVRADLYPRASPRRRRSRT